ncbi:MAG: hypothetical protein N3F07_00545 [Candidatus Micrarchaeota archaeon]|nr:hypothetical protein [Candidatus Micrarchaeota archaeon]
MDIVLLSAAACALLAFLVYLMWKEASKPEWQALAKEEKKDWRKKEKEHAKESFAQAAAKTLRIAYGNLPLLPFLDRQTSAIAYAVLAAYLAFMAWVFFFSPPIYSSIEVEVAEEPLQKNAQLSLFPGERYEYLVSFGQEPASISYKISRSADCDGAAVSEWMGQNLLQEACLLWDGTSAASNFSNLSAGAGMLLFSPWMLAASEGFSWSVETRMKNPAEYSFRQSFASKGSSLLYGREAFEVEHQSEGSYAKIFVDKQKRVLLYLSAGNISARLVSAPFELKSS